MRQARLTVGDLAYLKAVERAHGMKSSQPSVETVGRNRMCRRLRARRSFRAAAGSACFVIPDHFSHRRAKFDLSFSVVMFLGCSGGALATPGTPRLCFGD